MDRILVSGGFGFIGRNVVRELLDRGYKISVIDSLIDQVHGAGLDRCLEWTRDVEFFHADIRDRDRLLRVLDGCGGVVHLAAEVGVGQSMYEIERYTAGNDLATAALLEALIEKPVRRIVTASSMSVYGEGLYHDREGKVVENARRVISGEGQREWNPVDSQGYPLTPIETPEWKRPTLSSIYALGKYFQEQATHIAAGAYGIESVCLRLFNVYGPGQALSNPYTGVLANFASRLACGEAPMIFEDGRQRRDFVHVRDVARAFADALALPQAAGGTFNIGSGVDRSIRDVARDLGKAMGREAIQSDIVGRARAGDIRHCFCDLTLARETLGFEPREDFIPGLAELAQWVAGQTVQDRSTDARRELEQRGLVA
ncbi:MAG TPA: NAD-dependent epimerase/dehydratase family protein [Novosphingobium sp.]|nr:NAD-dependent epimerase/dehydratase family protein [Novosphingobium sp.]